MAEWLYALPALVLIGTGLWTLYQRHAQLPTVRGMADEFGDDEPGWELHGWPAVLVGCLELALGGGLLALTLGP